MNAIEAATAKAIVNIFETGRLLGDYSRVTVVPGDPGHLTYGRSQTSLASGNLYLLINAYCNTPGAAWAEQLEPYLAHLKACDVSLDADMPLRSFLAEAGHDPAMHHTQDQFFDRVYWNPAMTHAMAGNIATPLGVAVVYDSVVHGSWGKMRDRTNAAVGSAATEERAWIAKYVAVRRAWLAESPNPLLQRTVYRMDSFQGLIDTNRWQLELPLVIRGVEISAESLQQTTPVLASAHDPEERILSVTTPSMTGEDVRRVQRALAAAGVMDAASVDGVYGPITAAFVREFQTSNGLRSDGVVGPATRAALGL